MPSAPSRTLKLVVPPARVFPPKPLYRLDKEWGPLRAAEPMGPAGPFLEGVQIPGIETGAPPVQCCPAYSKGAANEPYVPRIIPEAECPKSIEFFGGEFNRSVSADPGEVPAQSKLSHEGFFLGF